MSIGISSSNGSSVNLMEILAQADKVASDSKKDSKVMRQLYHQKNMRHLDGNIAKLKEQSSQIGKAGWFNFIVGMFSNLFNIASMVVSVVLPGVGTAIATMANSAMQGLLKGIAQLNPFSKKARNAGIQAEEFKKLAKNSQYKFDMEDERLDAKTESQSIFKRRMERAIEDVQKAQEAAVRV